MATTGGSCSGSHQGARSPAALGREVPPALVLVVDAAKVSPWDPELLALVCGLEELLDGVHVTLAASGPGGPSLGDALAAVRFAGGRTAVVAVPPDFPARDLDRLLAVCGVARSDVRVVPIRAEMGEHAIVGQYREKTASEWTRVA